MNFKLTYLTALATTVTALQPAPAEANPSVAAKAAVKAFTDICLKTAPSFSLAEKEAAAHGITEISNEGGMKMGFNADQSVGIQIKPNKECVVTTDTQDDKTLTQQFIGAVAQHTSTTPARRVPFHATLGESVFIFQHDRNGGEAFVMLKQSN
jgi:hypothetical protein